MIVGRIVNGVATHLPTRVTEWALAAILFNWGGILLLPQETFAGASYQAMLVIAPESTWGVGCLAIGAARLLALVINGTFADSAYSRWSPRVRVVASVLSTFFWLQIVLSFVAGGTYGTGMAVYPVLLVLELYSAHRASRDTRYSDEAARNARRK